MDEYINTGSGVWITAVWTDGNYYDVRPWRTELDALRYVHENIDMRAKAMLVEFGQAYKG